MFSFFRRSSSKPISAAISRAINDQGMLQALGDATRLRMVESRGRYSDRTVTYFRIFDPTVTAERSLDIQRYRDLDAFQNLVLQAGHVESDGNVIIIRPAGIRAAETTRMRAGRIVAPLAPDPVVATTTDAPADTAAVDTAGSGSAR